MTLGSSICEICSMRPAVVAYTRRRNDDARRMLVCLDCARDRARLHLGSALDPGRLLSRGRPGSGGSGAPAYACRLCGATLADIVTDGSPGCCVCYVRFAGEVEQSIRAAQGHTHHTGKTPRR